MNAISSSTSNGAYRGQAVVVDYGGRSRPPPTPDPNLHPPLLLTSPTPTHRRLTPNLHPPPLTGGSKSWTHSSGRAASSEPHASSG